MLKELGEQLRDARNRRGISLRDASEATKIRGDLLMKFESGDGDFPLPGIYRRGFLKVYARFLKLNIDSVLRQYDEATTGDSLSRRNFMQGKMGQDAAYSDSKQSGSSHLGTIEVDIEESSHWSRRAVDSDQEEKTNLWEKLETHKYAKVGMMLGGVVFAIMLVFIGVSLGKKSKVREANRDLTVVTQGAHSRHSAWDDQAEEETIYLVATGDVNVAVRQECDKKRLFSGTLSSGDRIPIHKVGKVKIHFSEGNFLQIEKQGKLYSMNADGIAVRSFE